MFWNNLTAIVDFKSKNNILAKFYQNFSLFSKFMYIKGKNFKDTFKL